MSEDRKILVIQVAAFGHDLVRRVVGPEWNGLKFRAMDTVFPALTCPVQASFRTASYPETHGMTANGLFDSVARRAMFWEQSSAQVAGRRIWEDYRVRGKKVAMLFWQQSLGECADLVLSPAPIHKHHGGMIQDCYSMPRDLYTRIREGVGRKFNLMHYWGPMASAASSQWIAEATCWIMSQPDLAPDLCLTYLPALDYDLQRFGTRHKRSTAAIHQLMDQLSLLHKTAQSNGYDILVYGDYAIADCPLGAINPNLALRQAGLFETRPVDGMLYPDFHTSRAFAMVDHEIAHVYVRDPEAAHRARAVLTDLPGIEKVLHSGNGRSDCRMEHANAGALTIVARSGYWLAYPWWQNARQAPEYAGHVDIHNKPGYDPCELFFGCWPPGTVSLNATRIQGSHGRIGPGREVCWACSRPMDAADSVVALAELVRRQLNEEE